MFTTEPDVFPEFARYVAMSFNAVVVLPEFSASDRLLTSLSSGELPLVVEVPSADVPEEPDSRFFKSAFSVVRSACAPWVSPDASDFKSAARSFVIALVESVELSLFALVAAFTLALVEVAELDEAGCVPLSSKL